MKDLFRLSDDRDNNSTETSNLFSQLSQDVNIVASNASNQGLNGAAIVENENPATSINKSSKKKEKEKEKTDDSNEGEGGEETNILRSLFDAQGIHVSICFLVPAI